MVSCPACPTLDAFHHYVSAEIDALDGRRDNAVVRYDAAIELAMTVGSTVLQGIAAVGRLSNVADAGDTGRGARRLRGAH